MPKSHTAHCTRCGYERRFRKRRMNHGLHLTLTLISGGVWGIAWISATIKHAHKPWRCSFCGTRRPERSELRIAPELTDSDLCPQGLETSPADSPA